MKKEKKIGKRRKNKEIVRKAGRGEEEKERENSKRRKTVNRKKGLMVGWRKGKRQKPYKGEEENREGRRGAKRGN